MILMNLLHLLKQTMVRQLPPPPPQTNRITQRDYDKEIYKERNLVERFFQKIKHFHRIATRYERLARNYQAMLYLVSLVIWLA